MLAEPGDPGADHCDRHRHRDEFNIDNAALPQGDRDDGRRCRRCAHSHARADTVLPRDAAAHRRAAMSTSRSRRCTGSRRGRTERYIEKESELEEILLGRQVRPASRSSIDTTHSSRSPKPVGSASASCSSSTTAGRRRSGRASGMRQSHSSTSRESLDERVDNGAALVKLLSERTTNGHAFTTEVLSEDELEIVVRAVESESGLARTHRVRRAPARGARVPAAAARARGARRDRGHAAVHGHARRAERADALTFAALRDAGARRSPAAARGQPLQGARRDEPGAAARHDDGSRRAGRSCASLSRTPPRPTRSSRC